MSSDNYTVTPPPYIHNIGNVFNSILKKNGLTEIETVLKDEDYLYWAKKHGIGFYPVKEFVYNEEYFKKYATYEENGKAQDISKHRMEFVTKYWNGGTLVDIGIGSGTFVNQMACFGYDVNETGIAWLKDRGIFFDPYKETIGNATFWDSLEHIEDPTNLLKNVKHQIFVSCPIYRNLENIKTSKHFRPDEHFWYWTDSGFEKYMKYFGFKIIDRSDFEIKFGRHEIASYVLQRKY